MSEIKITVDLPQERIDQLNRIKSLLSKLLSGGDKGDYKGSEVCKLLSISESTLARWRERGLIEYDQRGKVIRYPKHAVEKRRIELYLKPKHNQGIPFKSTL